MENKMIMCGARQCCSAAVLQTAAVMVPTHTLTRLILSAQ